jgi:hypothetical protein
MICGIMESVHQSNHWILNLGCLQTWLKKIELNFFVSHLCIITIPRPTFGIICFLKVKFVV